MMRASEAESIRCASKEALQRSDEHQHLEKVELVVSPNTRMGKGVERFVQVLLKGHKPVGFEAWKSCLVTLNQYLISVADSIASDGVRYCDGGCCRHPHLGAGGFSHSFNPGGFPIQRHPKLASPIPSDFAAGDLRVGRQSKPRLTLIQPNPR